MEIWKDIKDFENKYQLSIDGEVKSLNYNNTGLEKILKPKINKQGHLEVTLNKDNKHYYKMVARLMIETFTNIKLNRNDIIMYKDNNKENCELTNLYLISRGKRQEITYDLDHRDRYKFEYYGSTLPIKEIARRNGINEKVIRRRLRNLYWNIYEAGEIPVAKYGKESKI